MQTYKNPGPIEFDAIIQEAGGGGAYVFFPGNVQELFGTKGRVPVRATFDHIGYRGSLAAMESGKHMLGILKAIRAQLGKDKGDTVHVRLVLDDLPRVVELAQDITQALKTAGKHESFKALSYSHQREYIQWIKDARQPQTRDRRIQKMVAAL